MTKIVKRPLSVILAVMMVLSLLVAVPVISSATTGAIYNSGDLSFSDLEAGDYIAVGVNLVEDENYEYTVTLKAGTYADSDGDSVYDEDSLFEDGMFDIITDKGKVVFEDWEGSFYVPYKDGSIANAFYVKSADHNTKTVTLEGADLPTDEPEPTTAPESATEPENADTYTVAGSSPDIFGTSWDASNTQNDMTKNGGVYSITYTDVEPENEIQFKVLKNHSWGESWGDESTGDNYWFSVLSTCDVTITFNPETKGISVSGDGVNRALYTVAGSSAAMFGTSWDASNTQNDMTKDGDVYSITYTYVEPENDIQLKVLKNHSWENSWGEKGTGDNYEFNVVSACEVTVTFNPETEEISVTGDGITRNTGLAVKSVIAVGGGNGNYLNGYNWNPCAMANSLEEVESGIWELKMTGVEAGYEYSLKFAVNSVDGAGNPVTNPWAHNFGAQYEMTYPTNEAFDAVYNGNNFLFDVEEDDSTVTVQLDLSNFDFTTKQGAKMKVSVMDPSSTEGYTITWMNGNEVIAIDENVAEGSTPYFTGEIPTKPDDDNYTYQFYGWSDGENSYSPDSLPDVTGDVTYYAQYISEPKTPASVYTTENGKTINLADTFTRDEEDTTEFGIGNEFKNFEILGVQKKSAASTEAGEENRAVRFVAALNNEVVQDADDYGFIAVAGDDMDGARANIADVTLDNAPKKNIFTCKGTNNSVSGEYGKYASEKGYKYITFAINNIKDKGVAVMFYLKDKNGNVYYAPYTNNGGATYTNCAVDWATIISAQ